MITKTQITDAIKLKSNSLTLTLSTQPLSANRQITFPAELPISGYSLISDATGNLSWSVPSLSGDVSGTTINNVVATVGGRTAASISASVADTLAATTNATALTLARRDAGGAVVANGFSSFNSVSGWTQRSYVVAVPAVGSATLFASIPTNNNGSAFIITIQASGVGAPASSKSYLINVDSVATANSRCIPNYINGSDATNDYDLNIEITTVINFRIVRRRGTATITANVQMEYFGDTATFTTPNTVSTITAPTIAYRGALGSSIKDVDDPTKILTFDTSAITTGTTRTFAFPNVNDTLVGTTATQTITNKTINDTTNNIFANGLRTANWTYALSTVAPTAGQYLGFNGTNLSWSSIGSIAPVVVTTSQTIPNTVDKVLATSGITITLPTSSPPNSVLTIVNSDGNILTSGQIVIRATGTINNLTATTSGAWINNPYGAVSLIFNGGNWTTIGNYGFGRARYHNTTSYTAGSGIVHRYDTQVELSGIFSNISYFSPFGVGGTTGTVFYNRSGKPQVCLVQAGMYVFSGATVDNGILDIGIEVVSDTGGTGTLRFAEAENFLVNGLVNTGGVVSSHITKTFTVESGNGVRINNFSQFGNMTFSPTATAQRQNFINITQIA